MNEIAEKILLERYKIQISDGISQHNVHFSQESFEHSQQVNAIQELESNGCIITKAKAVGFVIFEITSYGLAYAESLE